MITDPVIGSLVWVTSSLAFLAASSAVVRMLDARTPALPAARAERDGDREPAA